MTQRECSLPRVQIVQPTIILEQEGMKRLKNLEKRPSGKDLFVLGNAWRPFRGAGALMLWHIYGILVRKATIDEI